MTCTFRWCEMTGHFHCRNDPPAQPHEPTTAEAFETLRGLLDAYRVFGGSDPAVREDARRGVDALSLLERRMQEVERETERLRAERQAHLLEQQRLNALGDPYSR